MARHPDRALPSRTRATTSVAGRITIVQEARFRLVDDAGAGYLFTLDRFSRVDSRRLERWLGDAARVRVSFRGYPDLGAVAQRVQLDG